MHGSDREIQVCMLDDACQATTPCFTSSWTCPSSFASLVPCPAPSFVAFLQCPQWCLSQYLNFPQAKRFLELLQTAERTLGAETG